jgi:hypothetical protein
MRGISSLFILAFALSVKSNPNTPTIKDNLPANVAYVGCLVDAASRTLPIKMLLLQSITVEACHSACSAASHPYSGVEAGSECWCGDTLNSNIPIYSGSNENKMCNVACYGDSTQVCGGYWALNVYLDSSVTTTVPTVIKKTGLPYNVAYLGCFGDSVNRILPIKMQDQGTMTFEMCHALCSAAHHPYFALESGQECYCSDNFNVANAIYSGDQECGMCNTQCRGNAPQICGGTWAANVYYDSSVTPTLPTQIKKTGLPNSVQYLGCFADFDAPTRILPVKLQGWGDLSLEICRSLCSASNYPYSGLEYGKECWCGDKFNLSNPIYSGNMETNMCNMQCSQGSTGTEICGGPWAANVYYDSSVTPIPPPQTKKTDLPGHAQYLGCADSTVLSIPLQDGKYQTVSSCIAACTALNYSYSGVHGGSECRCGNAISNNIIYQDEGNCKTRCKGNSSETCGGHSYVNVYSCTPPVAPPKKCKPKSAKTKY